MRLFVDLDSQNLTQLSGINQSVGTLGFKRSSSASIEVVFSRAGIIQELPGDAQGIFGIKETNRFDADYVTASLSWVKTGSGTSTIYSFSIPLINSALNALFHVDGDPSNDVPQITLMGELQWSYGGVVYKTPTVVIQIDNDVNRGGELAPAGIPYVPGQSTVRDYATVSRKVVDFLISGLSPGDSAQKMFTTYDNSGSGTYVRSTTWFGRGLDWTGLSVYNDGDNRFAGFMVSPRHMMVANHTGNFGPGRIMRFAKADGTPVQRTISSVLQVGTTDMLLCKLDSDMPEGIGFFRVWQKVSNYLESSLAGGSGIWTDQNRYAYIGDYSGTATFNESTDDSRSGYWKPGGAVGGDSSHPLLVVIDGTLVLIGHTHSGGPISVGDGDPYFDNFNAINIVMAALGGGYQLTGPEASGLANSAYIRATAGAEIGQIPLIGVNGINAGLIPYAPYAFALWHGFAHSNPEAKCIEIDGSGGPGTNTLKFTNIDAVTWAAGIASKFRTSLGLDKIVKIIGSGQVNFNSATNQVVFTTPAGTNAIITDIIFHHLSAAGSVARFTIGWNGALGVVGPTAVRLSWFTSVATTARLAMAAYNSNIVSGNMLNSPCPMGVPGDALGVTVTVAEGSALTAKVDILGYLVDSTGVPVDEPEEEP